MRELWNRMTSSPETARKFVAALIGALTTAVAVGVLPNEYNAYVAIAISFATALGVYAVPNEGLAEDEDTEDISELIEAYRENLLNKEQTDNE